MTYRARTLAGDVVEGSVRSRDEAQARLRLSEKGLETLSIECPSEERGGASSPGQAESQRATGRLFGRVRLRELQAMTSQLALMLEAGTPLAESLAALSRQSEGRRLGDVLGAVHKSVTGGSSLSESLRGHPKVFGEFYASAVKAGESAGDLQEVLRRLESHMERRQELACSVRNALTYPMILTVLACGAVAFLVSYVLPKFTLVFQRSATLLPLPTRLLLEATDFCRAYWYLVILGIVGPPVGAYLFFTSRAGKPIWDNIVLKLPVAGTLATMLQSSVLLRTLATLLGAGVPLVESLNVTRETCTNTLFQKAVDRMSIGVLRGEGFSANFSQTDLFSPPVEQMVETGEKTGSLALVMEKTADHLDRAARQTMKRLSAVFEPLIIVAMGLVIGFIAISILLPLFRMGAAVGGGG